MRTMTKKVYQIRASTLKWQTDTGYRDGTEEMR